MSRQRSVFATSLVVLAIFGASIAHAWDLPSGGAAVGRVANVEVNADGSFYISLVGNPQLCPSASPDWRSRGLVMAGAIQGTSPTVTMSAEGVRTMHATVMAAFLSGKQITVYANNPGAGPGYACRVGSIFITP